MNNPNTQRPDYLVLVSVNGQRVGVEPKVIEPAASAFEEVPELLPYDPTDRTDLGYAELMALEAVRESQIAARDARLENIERARQAALAVHNS